MLALLLLIVFAAGLAIGLLCADAIARQRVKSWAVVRELMGL
jgi:uncharacterized membrane protein YciS (DUF1049 family)